VAWHFESGFGSGWLPGRDLLRVNWAELKAELKREIGGRGVKFVGLNTAQTSPLDTAGSSEADARGRGPGTLGIARERDRRTLEFALESVEAAREEPTEHIEGDGEAKSDEDIMADTAVTAENNQAKTAVCRDTVLKRIKKEARFQVAISMGISFFATFAILGLGYCWRYVSPGDRPEHNIVIQWMLAMLLVHMCVGIWVLELFFTWPDVAALVEELRE
jgi:hypothetical protein